MRRKTKKTDVAKGENAKQNLKEAIKRSFLRHEIRTKVRPQDWLEAATTRPDGWWVAQFQSLVTKHSRATDNPDHGTTDVRAVMRDLVDMIVDSGPPDEVYDENMRTAAIMGEVCSLWYARVQRAKCSDPERPLFFRQLAYKRWLEFGMALVRAVMDESQDAVYFPGQKWQYPFDPSAKGGKFI